MVDYGAHACRPGYQGAQGIWSGDRDAGLDLILGSCSPLAPQEPISTFPSCSESLASPGQLALFLRGSSVRGLAKKSKTQTTTFSRQRAGRCPLRTQVP